jgi:hypothetical protein
VKRPSIPFEGSESGEATAVRVLAAVKRERHGRRVADLEKKDDPPGAGASFQDRMAHRVATKAGRQLYKQRQQTIEPVFGILKETIQGSDVFRCGGKSKPTCNGPWCAWPTICAASTG